MMTGVSHTFIDATRTLCGEKAPINPRPYKGKIEITHCTICSHKSKVRKLKKYKVGV